MLSRAIEVIDLFNLTPPDAACLLPLSMGRGAVLIPLGRVQWSSLS